LAIALWITNAQKNKSKFSNKMSTKRLRFFNAGALN
jgi:hypothetical protein